MHIIDDYLSVQLEKHKEVVKKDFLSLLHIVLNLFKIVPDIRVRRKLNKSNSMLLATLSEMDVSRFIKLDHDKFAKDEFERIT